MMVGYHGLSLSLGTRVEVLCECASQGGGPGPGRPVAEAHNHDMNTGARMCSQSSINDSGTWSCAARAHFSETTSTGTGKPGCLGVVDHTSGWQYLPLKGVA